MNPEAPLRGIKSEKVDITIQKAEVINKNRIRVKIAETHVNLMDMDHMGMHYKVVKNLGRGRYIMRVHPRD